MQCEHSSSRTGLAMATLAAAIGAVAATTDGLEPGVSGPIGGTFTLVNLSTVYGSGYKLSSVWEEF